MLSSLRPLASKAAHQAAGKAPCSALAAGTGTALGAGAAERLAATGLPQLVFTSSAAHSHKLAGHVEQPARVDTVMERLGAIASSSAFQSQVGRRRQAGGLFRFCPGVLPCWCLATSRAPEWGRNIWLSAAPIHTP